MVLRPTGGGAQAHGRGGVGIGGSVLRLTAFWISPGWLAANVLAESTQQSFLSSIIKGSQTQDRDKQTVCLACQVDISAKNRVQPAVTLEFLWVCVPPHTHTHTYPHPGDFIATPHPPWKSCETTPLCPMPSGNKTLGRILTYIASSKTLCPEEGARAGWGR